MGELKMRPGLDDLRDETAWARFLVELCHDRWVLRYGHVVVSDRPASWPDGSWTYEGIRFLAAQTKVAYLASVLGTEGESRLVYDGLEFFVPATRESNVQHRPSFEVHDRHPSPLPSFDYSRTRRENADPIYRPGFVVGPDSPTFTDLDSAFRAFFLGVYSPETKHSIPNEILHVRVSDRRAWIGPIHVRPAEIDVEIGGDNCAGLTLEYTSPTFRTRQEVDRPGTKAIALPRGMDKTNTWLWLTRGTEWLDYRALSGPWASDRQLEEAGVNLEFTSRDAQAIVEATVYGGEGPAIEFKRELPKTMQRTASMFKTVAAFANGAGGTIVIGMDPDESTIVGIGATTDVSQTRDRLGQLIRGRVVPTPDFKITQHCVSDKSLMFVEVRPSPTPPYGVIMSTDERDKPQYFVRRGASTYPAQPSDLNEIVQRAVAIASTAGSSVGHRLR